MRQVYGADSVAAVVCVHDTSSVEAAAAKYQQLQTELEGVSVLLCRRAGMLQAAGTSLRLLSAALLGWQVAVLLCC
jgi:hypothetical protein